MKNVFLSIVTVFALSGCGAWDRGVASVSGVAPACVDGVLYLQFTSGVSVAYTPYGNIKSC